MVRSVFHRRPVVIANWKMYLGAAESVRAAHAIRRLTARLAGRDAEIVLCPCFPVLAEVRGALVGSRLQLGAQELHHEPSGPYTGDVSANQLRGLIRYVVVGHSERRRFHGETDEMVARKVQQALRAGFSPIICVGETTEEREEEKTIAKVRRQVEIVVRELSRLSLSRCLFAYEPVWAISAGPGMEGPQPDPAEAAHLMRLVRKVAADRIGSSAAERVRVLYGGSVTAKTVRPFVSEPGVDGVLVGGASTKPAEFAAIVREVVAACRS
ncbi:MAG: triosephosphate isomerase (TIM) [Parcubacteria group bacterium Gr01-1014_38]|nr:MAG: triosephosphate isomerase (TIM) [Parcubacteria group bacterium Gr01-1014_38]